ncbi:MAG: hypothetical protein JSR37_06405 [Verrucomicrobia bacterium]|nr:hypothetical protein [Verrucomicrobiota bacterium]MBS0636466.1 hypothetical protein [Verrucomicrobiota bacterium]
MIVDSRSTTICFAVQHVLAARYDHEIFELARHSNASVLTANKIHHYLFPGAIELLQLLFEVPNVQVAFFDDEDKEKVEEFVQMLLSYALGPNKYEEVKKSIAIWSRKDLAADDFEAYRQQKRYFEFTQNVLKLDMRRLLNVSSDCMLVDSKPAYLPAGKEATFLASPQASTGDYMDCSDDIGPQPIDFHFARFRSFNEYKDHHKNVATGNYILLVHLLEKDTYYACFTQDNCLDVAFCPFTEYEAELFKAIQLEERTYQREELNSLAHHLVAMILTRITTHHARIERISRKANHIYFLAGAIFEALERSRKEQRSATGIYFSMQFQKKNGKFQPSVDTFHAQDRLYYRGLELLRTKNPTLRFLGKE